MFFFSFRLIGQVSQNLFIFTGNNEWMFHFSFGSLSSCYRNAFYFLLHCWLFFLDYKHEKVTENQTTCLLVSTLHHSIQFDCMLCRISVLHRTHSTQTCIWPYTYLQFMHILYTNMWSHCVQHNIYLYISQYTPVASYSSYSLCVVCTSGNWNYIHQQYVASTKWRAQWYARFRPTPRSMWNRCEKITNTHTKYTSVRNSQRWRTKIEKSQLYSLLSFRAAHWIAWKEEKKKQNYLSRKLQKKKKKLHAIRREIGFN